MSQNWRDSKEIEDYLLHQQKQQDLNNRRPVIRRAADLVGPGIAATAVRVTNFNDLLAQYDGFFSAAPGALNAPDSEQGFIGFIASDAELGGVQILFGLTDQMMYRRVFTRNAADPDFIAWGAWLVGAIG